MMIKVIAKIPVKPGSLDKVEPLLRKLVAESKTHAGCEAYETFQSLDNENLIIMVETWADGDALKAHAKNENFRAISGEIKPYQDEGGEIMKLRQY